MASEWVQYKYYLGGINEIHVYVTSKMATKKKRGVIHVVVLRTSYINLAKAKMSSFTWMYHLQI